MNSTKPCVGKRPIVQAVEDALVVGLTSLIGGLIATGAQYPPEGEILYGAGLAALLAALFAYAQARRLQLPGGK